MSPVQSVTDVPVHSLLSNLLFLLWLLREAGYFCRRHAAFRFSRCRDFSIVSARLRKGVRGKTAEGEQHRSSRLPAFSWRIK